MKTMEIFILKNFTEKKTVEFANAICNCAKNLGLFKFKNIVVEKSGKYFKLCAKPSSEDLIKIEAYNNGAPLAENLDIFNDRHLILLVGLYLLNSEDTQKKFNFKIENDENILWIDNDLKSQKVTDAKEYYSYLKFMPMLEGTGDIEIVDYTKVDPIILLLALQDKKNVLNIIKEKEKKENHDVIIKK